MNTTDWHLFTDEEGGRLSQGDSVSMEMLSISWKPNLSETYGLRSQGSAQETVRSGCRLG